MTFESLRVLVKSDPAVFAESITRFGLRLIGKKDLNPLNTEIQVESVASIASTITEDAHTHRAMTSDMKRIKFLAEQHGYIVELI